MVNRKKRLFFLTAAAVLCLMAASCGSASDGFDGRMAGAFDNASFKE